MEDYKALLEQLLQQERDFQFSEFSNGTAVKLGTAILEKAEQEGKRIAVDIRKNGELLFHAKMDGTGYDNDRWIERKRNVVHHFEHSSYYMHVLYKSENTTIEKSAYLDSMEYAAEGGSFPILIKNVGIIGTVSVSGLEGHEDHEMIAASLRKLLQPSAV